MALLLVFNHLSLLVQANPRNFARIKRQHEAIDDWADAKGLEKATTDDCSNADVVCVCEFGPNDAACAYVAQLKPGFE